MQRIFCFFLILLGNVILSVRRFLFVLTQNQTGALNRRQLTIISDVYIGVIAICSLLVVLNHHLSYIGVLDFNIVQSGDVLAAFVLLVNLISDSVFLIYFRHTSVLN
jgi:hypothetical protein